MREFWALTPREVYQVVQAAQWRAERAHRRDGWLAWHVAALTRARRLPELQQMFMSREARPLHGEELERRRREHEEMLERLDLDQINEVMRGR